MELFEFKMISLSIIKTITGTLKSNSPLLTKCHCLLPLGLHVPVISVMLCDKCMLDVMYKSYCMQCE